MQFNSAAPDTSPIATYIDPLLNDHPGFDWNNNLNWRIMEGSISVIPLNPPTGLTPVVFPDDTGNTYFAAVTGVSGASSLKEGTGGSPITICPSAGGTFYPTLTFSTIKIDCTNMAWNNAAVSPTTSATGFFETVADYSGITYTYRTYTTGEYAGQSFKTHVGSDGFISVDNVNPAQDGGETVYYIDDFSITESGDVEIAGQDFTHEPTDSPTSAPTWQPSWAPTWQPSWAPTDSPTTVGGTPGNTNQGAESADNGGSSSNTVIIAAAAGGAVVIIVLLVLILHSVQKGNNARTQMQQSMNNGVGFENPLYDDQEAGRMGETMQTQYEDLMTQYLDVGEKAGFNMAAMKAGGGYLVVNHDDDDDDADDNIGTFAELKDDDEFAEDGFAMVDAGEDYDDDDDDNDDDDE